MPSAYPMKAYELCYDPGSGQMVFRGTEAVLGPIFDKYKFASRLVVAASDIERELGGPLEGIPRDIMDTELAMPIDAGLLNYPHVTFAHADTLNPFRSVGFHSPNGVLQFCQNLEKLYLKVAQWIHGRVQLSIAKGLRSRINWGSFLGLTLVEFLDMVAPGVSAVTGPVPDREVIMKNADDEDIIMDELNESLPLIFHPVHSNMVRSGLLQLYDPLSPDFNADYYAPSPYVNMDSEDIPGLLDYLVSDIAGAVPLSM
ncbi:hypothetical protein PQX77_015164 [Marasmius sp. AFHP31]|nr:hypothetical protein PQX77_015164 [Marasmius sp. AFHP31]